MVSTSSVPSYDEEVISPSTNNNPMMSTSSEPSYEEEIISPNTTNSPLRKTFFMTLAGIGAFAILLGAIFNEVSASNTSNSNDAQDAPNSKTIIVEKENSETVGKLFGIAQTTQIGNANLSFQSPMSESVVSTADAYYVSQMSNEGTVRKFDLEGNLVSEIVDLVNPRGLAINDDGTKIWAACDNYVAEITLQDGNFLPDVVQYETNAVAGMDGPNGLCLSPEEDMLYVTDPGVQALAVIALATGELTVLFDEDTDGIADELSPNGCVVMDGKVTMINQFYGINSWDIATGTLGDMEAFSSPIYDISNRQVGRQIADGIVMYGGKTYASTWGVGPNAGATIWECPMGNVATDATCTAISSENAADLQLDLKTPSQPQLLMPNILGGIVKIFALTQDDTGDDYIEDDDDIETPGLCFSGNMKVVVQGKGTVKMEDLQVGDFVKIWDSAIYEPVYAFGHHDPQRYTKFVQLYTSVDNSPLEMTDEHLVFVEGKNNPVRAASIKVGDVLQAQDNNAVVQKINFVHRNGIYNPLTASGTIQVNGITASNYISFQKESNEYVELPGGIKTTMSHHDFAHRAMTPFRFYCTALAICQVKDANSHMPDYIFKGMQLIEWSKHQNIAVQLLIWGMFRMVVLILSIMMVCTVLGIIASLISGKSINQLQRLFSLKFRSSFHLKRKNV